MSLPAHIDTNVSRTSPSISAGLRYLNLALYHTHEIIASIVSRHSANAIALWFTHVFKDLRVVVSEMFHLRAHLLHTRL